MTSSEAFKVGFFTACADRGLDRAGAEKLINKTASMLANLAGAATLALPVGAGLGAGYLAAKATAPLEDVDDLQQVELIQELQRLARQARDRQLQKRMVGTP
jgi:hypothetical protein